MGIDELLRADHGLFSDLFRDKIVCVVLIKLKFGMPSGYPKIPSDEIRCVFRNEITATTLFHPQMT